MVIKFSEEEVKNAVWDCGGSKSPGPDGFNFNFIKSCWEVHKVDVMAAVQLFHTTGSLRKGCNASFIALIPKVRDPSTLDQFRPISLVGVIYKIITKVLSSRMKKIMPLIIDECQSAFIRERGLLDSVVMANEVLEEIKRKRKSGVCFKVDFEKAYDSVRWNFLFDMLHRLGFHEKWILWVKGCLVSSSVSVLVNGSPIEEFKPSRGLRQGDPMAPFLFLVVAEGLAGLVRQALRTEVLRGIKVGRNNVECCLLQFADDTLFMCEASFDSIFTIKAILRCFEIVSGLKVNFHKSKLTGIKVDNFAMSTYAKTLNCNTMKLPFLYLGLEMGGNPRKKQFWDPVSWDNVCKPLEDGGLGVKEVKNFNAALLAKWRRRIISNEGGKWMEIISSKYSSSAENMHLRSKDQSWWWKDIIKVCGEGVANGWFQKAIGWKVGNGAVVRLWKDLWLGNECLRSTYPRLFSLSLDQGKKVGEVGEWEDNRWRWNLNWKRVRFQWETELEVEMLSRLSLGALSKDTSDQLLWKGDQKGMFSVKSAYSVLTNHQTPASKESVFSLLWQAKAMPKVLTTAWRILIDRIPSRVNLLRRGVPVTSTLCALCNRLDESSQHLFLECVVAQQVWSRVSSRFAECRVLVLEQERNIRKGRLHPSRYKVEFLPVFDRGHAWKVDRLRSAPKVQGYVGALPDQVSLV
ncbi:uncharacterized protein [Phaseolus vulgaris]|uniref:uncharacterized protein n=1 Tax=Phaseolus vulgaris TaxID=3885 RepID=UPI0035CAF07C